MPASAGRFTKNTRVALKLQPTQGTDSIASSPVAADFIKATNQSIKIGHTMVDRGELIPTFGSNGKVYAGSSFELGFDFELAGSGAAGTAPGHDTAFKVCGLAATVNAGSNVTYNPITAGQQAGTGYAYDSGDLLKGLDLRGNLEKISFAIDQVPKASIKLVGAYGGDAQVAVPTTLPATTWAHPLGVCDTNTGDVTFGATYTLATGAIAGGTAYSSAGVEVALGNAVQYTKMLGQEVGDITGRTTTLSVTVDCTPAQEAAFRAQLQANTAQTVVFVHGTTAGNKVQIYAPAAQLTNVDKADQNGRRLVKLDFECKQTNGNDDIYFAFL
jgi:hypothetical protein